MLTRVARQIYALQNTCTHSRRWLHLGRLHPESLEIECPLHEGRFDLRTGAATREPCKEPVDVFEVRLEGDDILVGPPLGAREESL